MHLGSLTSKRCASITYCNSLFRPAFCPFCMGDDQLPASSRWNSWTREAKLWSHLGTHLGASHWPLKCPHPLCSLQLQDETSFLYHLSDVHSLQMSPYMRKSWQSERYSEPLVHWIVDTTCQKRRREHGDEQDLGPLKRSNDPLQTNRSTELSSRQSLDLKTPNRIQATPLPGSSAASFTHVGTVEDAQDLPELTYSESMSPPDTDELHSMDDLCLSQNVLHTELHSELGSLRDLSETKSNEHGSPLPGQDALFSQYLRSRSPSCFSAQGIGGHHNIDGGIHSQIVTPSDICLDTEEDSNPAALIDQNTAQPKNIPVMTNKPRITLRIRQPKPGPKPKVRLRLSQPKQVPGQRSVRQGIKYRRRQRT